MEDFAASITNGNVREVKVVLATLVAVLAIYQIGLMAVGYGKLRLPFLAAAAASKAHRAIGDTIVVLTGFIAFLCIAYFGLEDDAAVHIALSLALIGTLGFKVAVLRWLPQFDHLLPALGIGVFLLFWATWASVAARHLL